MNQIIPDTDERTVAHVAAALALVLASKDVTQDPAAKVPLDKLLELYKKAYKAVHEAE